MKRKQNSTWRLNTMIYEKGNKTAHEDLTWFMKKGEKKKKISKCSLPQPLSVSSELSPQLSMPLHVTSDGTQRSFAHLNMSLQLSEIQEHTIEY